MRRLPAEWEPQCSVMLVWPHDDTDWAPCLEQVAAVYAEIALNIIRHESLLIVCRDIRHRSMVMSQLESAGADLSRVVFSCAPSNDTWIRDTGPITVLDGDTPKLLHFKFNGWGDKYPHHLDRQLTRRLHEAGVFRETPCCSIDFTLEGGSIESDGNGVLLTTRRCLLSPSRNPGLDEESIAALCSVWFGARRIIWLKHGLIIGDDTDGHIDMLARFCDPHTIAYCACEDTADVHYTELQAMAAELSALTTDEGKPYRLVPLPLPAPIIDASGQRLPASYANFLIINQAVLAPCYDDPADEVALSRLATCFPGREVIGIPCRRLIQQHGSLHCVTMQLPAGVL